MLGKDFRSQFSKTFKDRAPGLHEIYFLYQHPYAHELCAEVPPYRYP